ARMSRAPLLLACRAGAAVESRAEEGRVMIRMPVAVAAAALASLLGFSPGARGDTSIAAIVDHPDDYANTQVTVVGTVAAPSLGERAARAPARVGRKAETVLGAGESAVRARVPQELPGERR